MGNRSFAKLVSNNSLWCFIAFRVTDLLSFLPYIIGFVALDMTNKISLDREESHLVSLIYFWTLLTTLMKPLTLRKDVKKFIVYIFKHLSL